MVVAPILFITAETSTGNPSADMRDSNGNATTIAGLPSKPAGKVLTYRNEHGHIVFTDRPVTASGYHLISKRTYDEIDAGFTRTPHLPIKVTSSGSAKTGRRKAQYDNLIAKISETVGVDANLVHAVIQAESAYNPKARSPAGAIGLMQLMPATAKHYGVTDIWDPEQNITGGARYLRALLKHFNNDMELTAAAYNAGEGAVIKYGRKIPPYKETRVYVRRVIANYKAMQK